MFYSYTTPVRKKTRISYKRLTDAVNYWNEQYGLKYLDAGFLKVGNDGDNHWLEYFYKEGSTAVNKISGTTGTLRSCYDRLTYLSHNPAEFKK